MSLSMKTTDELAKIAAAGGGLVVQAGGHAWWDQI